jgi:hypothetical protein
MRIRLQRLEQRQKDDVHHRTGKLIRDAQQACAVIALESLRSILKTQAATWWVEQVGLVPEGVSERHLLDLCVWVNSMSCHERKTFHAIMDVWHTFRTDYKEHLPANRAWLEKAARRGINLAFWLHPEPRTNQRALGAPTRLEVARDPMQVFLMGSYFDTCLNVRSGINRMSVLANAYHANKAVLLLKDDRGRVLGRKLVAVSRNLQLLGYHTYLDLAGWDGASWERAANLFSVYCASWARRCGLALADRGEPEVFAGHFWYDDEPEPWPAAARTA